MAESTASAPSSSTLASDFTDDLAFQSGPGSSKTSIVTILADSVYGMEDNEEEEESEVYELQRVQTTQSMGIQRGVLVACRASNLPYTLPPIFESSESISRISRISLLGDQQRIARPSNKYLDSTPSAASLASSVSVDLADFPLPPVSAR